jgi:Hypoxia induced protein conserved region
MFLLARLQYSQPCRACRFGPRRLTASAKSRLRARTNPAAACAEHRDRATRRLSAGRAARYTGGMELVLPILVALAMLATLAMLFMGLISMARGGDPQRSNKFMRYRIWFQGTALLLFVIFMMLYRR